MISFHSICQSPRKLCATSDQADDRASAARASSCCSPAAWCWWPLSACCGVLARLAPRAAVRRTARSSTRHQHDHHDPAEVLGERELPADQHPQHEAELPHEVRRGELEGERGRRRGALLEQALGDRDRRVGARGRGGAEAGRERDRPCARAGQATLRSARAAPRPARSRRSRSPSTSAHQTSQAIRNESFRPCQITSERRSSPRFLRRRGWVCGWGRRRRPRRA